MADEQTIRYIEDHETDIKAITAYLDLLDKDWRKKIAPAAKGAAGTMTPKEDETVGYVTPNTTYGANIRYGASTAKDNPPLYRLEYGQTLGVDGRAVDAEGKINPATGKPFIWYMVLDGDDNFVREDVVTFTPEHITPSLPVPSVAVLNATIWPAPCRGTITNTHHNERHHDGIDIACAIGTPVTAGPNGGYVSKAYVCRHCKPNGDGIASLNDASKAYGYGSHVVIRYAYALLPQRIQAMIPHGAFLFAMHAHLSAVNVSQGQTLEPYQVIGAVGATGNTYGANPWHLHFALHWSADENADFYSIRANAIDPLVLIKGN